MSKTDQILCRLDLHWKKVKYATYYNGLEFMMENYFKRKEIQEKHEVKRREKNVYGKIIKGSTNSQQDRSGRY